MCYKIYNIYHNLIYRMENINITDVLKRNNKLSRDFNKTEFDYNVITGKIIIVKTDFSYCSWCKSCSATCAVKFTMGDNIYERPVCDNCKISFGLSMLYNK